MRKTILAAMAAAILGAGVAMAQTVVIEPQQRTLIKEYVVKEKVRPVTVKEKITVGGILPADIDLVVVPPAWGPSVQPYRYVYHDDRVVLVDPNSRRVVHVID